jgi:hypothetical protein
VNNSSNRHHPLSFDRSRLHRRALALAIGVALTLIAGAAMAASRHPFDIDFYVFYESALAWRSGTDLYVTAREFPNLNPPHFVIWFAPFTFMTPHIAVRVWTACNMLAGAAAAVYLWRELALPRSFASVGLAIAAAGLTTGLQFGLEEGQPTGLFAWLFTAAWAAARSDRQTRAGVLLGLLISVKPFFAVMLLVPLLRKQWTLLIAAGLAGASMLVGGVMLAGVHSYVRWLEVGRAVSWFVHPLNASITGPISRAGLTWHVWAALSVAIAGATILVVRRSEDSDLPWAAAGLASLLISPLGWLYYFPLLAGPLTALAVNRPVVLAAGLGVVWPLPMVLAGVPISPWTAVIVYSVPTWSLLGTWMLILGLRFHPRQAIGSADRERPEAGLQVC